MDIAGAILIFRVRIICAFTIKGDAGRTINALIAAVDSVKPPFRLALGSTAYLNIKRELARRLAEIESQREVAFSADQDAAGL